MVEELSLFNEIDLGEEVNIKYTSKLNAPLYLPKNRMPHLVELVDKSKFHKLLSDIERSSVSEEEKEFLRVAASRHAVFNYSLIADYYAHASKEMQCLMEDSALVIVDFDKAIEGGFVKLTKQLEAIMLKEKKANYGKE